jgi:DnaA family protein
MEQLPLGVRLRTSSTFGTFHPGENVALVTMLRGRASESGLPPVWLSGMPGVGRTHLLQATCALAGEHGAASAYLPCGADWLTPGMLAGLEQLAVVCVDDVDLVAGRAEWEGALFVLYNELAERGGRLVCAARGVPATLPISLPDLRSRLAASLVWQVRALPEDTVPAALQSRAAALGLELPDETLQYLLRRLPRGFAELCDVLDRLDGAALARQRRLTVPFVKSVLEPGDG